MGEFTGVCLGFPTVLFGGALVVVVGFWALVLVGGADAHGPGHHGAGGGAHHGGHGGHVGQGAHHGGHAAHGHGHVSAHVHEAHGHAGAHAPSRHSGAGHRDADGTDGSDGSDGRHDAGQRPAESGLLAAAGLDGVPVTVVLSLLIALAWFLSLAGSAALDGAGAHGPVRVVLSFALLAAALVGSWLLTWVFVRPLRRLFPYEVAPSREDFVGRIGVVRTGAVTARFGQAEVAAPDGSTAVVQVRQTGEDIFAAGGTALLYAYDPEGEFFWVAPFDDPAAAPPGGHGVVI